MANNINDHVKMTKVLTVVGARPQFVKAAVVSREILARTGITERIIHTGQHFDGNMSDIFFDEMEIPVPDYNLNINGMTHGKMTGKMLEGLEEVMLAEKPDVLLVYGDTNSTLAGALAASKIEIPIAHIEAGLRSFNMSMPEEINRILTDRVSSWLFCPTETAVNNLIDEGYENFDNKIHLCGDVMYDAALYYSEKIKLHSVQINVPEEPFVLVTVHRQENIIDIDKLRQIVSLLNELSQNKKIIFALHPGTAKKIKHYGLKLNFETIDPVGYFDIIRLLQNCEFVITDSGGLQKEAFFFNKFCLTLRDQTEWVELVDSKVNFICGANKEEFFRNVELLPSMYPKDLKLYGDGDAGVKIVDQLLN